MSRWRISRDPEDVGPPGPTRSRREGDSANASGAVVPTISQFTSGCPQPSRGLTHDPHQAATGRRPLRPPRTSTTPAASRMVARLDNEPAPRGRRAGRSRRSTTSSTAAPRAPTSRTGDGAGILLQMPDAFFRGVVDFELPDRRAATASASASCRRTRRAASSSRQLLELNVRAEGQIVLGWRDVPIDDGARRRHARTPAARTSASSSSRPGPGFADDQDAFERKLYVIRRICRARRRAGLLLAVASPRARSSTRGCSSPTSCAASTPTCATSASRSAHGARALALLDEHVPELGARPSLPRDRPQRRDQHADGQRQLDARARVAARQRAVRRRPAEGHADRAPGRLGLGDVRQRPRAAHARRPLAAARGDDDDPRGLRGPRRPLRRAQGLLRLPLLPHGAVGRPGGGRVHRTAASSARRSTATACVPGAGSRRTTAASSSAPRPACSTIEPGNVKRLGRLQPGKLFLVDLEQGRIVEDEEVKREVATQQPYGEWFRAQRRALRRPRAGARAMPPVELPLRQRQLAFGYSQEDLRVLLAPMAANGEEPIGSMGNDNALAVLSRQPPAAVHLLQAALRAGHQPADRPDPRGDRHVARHRRRRRGQPARRDARARPPARAWTSRSCATTSSRRSAASSTDVFKAHTIDITWPIAEGPDGHAEARWPTLCDEAHDAIAGRASTS